MDACMRFFFFFVIILLKFFLSETRDSNRFTQIDSRHGSAARNRKTNAR